MTPLTQLAPAIITTKTKLENMAAISPENKNRHPFSLKFMWPVTSPLYEFPKDYDPPISQAVCHLNKQTIGIVQILRRFDVKRKLA